MNNPYGLPRGCGGPTEAPLATSRWFDEATLEAEAKLEGSIFSYQSGAFWLGRTASGQKVGYTDNRHLLTVAGSRAGKGTDAIVPTLTQYPGSVLVIDPKGENARLTAVQRGFGNKDIKHSLGQNVYVLDPYGVSGVDPSYLATFDPLANITEDNPEAVEDAALIADAVVIAANKKDPHWDEAAKNLVTGLILHLQSWPAFEGQRTMGYLHSLLFKGDFEEHTKRVIAAATELQRKKDADEPITRAPNMKLLTSFQILLELMSKNDAFGGAISAIGQAFKDMSEREFNSVVSNARRNLTFAASRQMKNVMGEDKAKPKVDLDSLKTDKHGVSIYVVLPARRIASHSRWIRLIMNLTISRMEAVPQKPASGHPVLAVCDEFAATLGYLESIESAIAYMAGFDLKIWTILQDLGQLQRLYDSWETFIGNAGIITAFGLTDQASLDYFSKYMGEVEIIHVSTSVDNGGSASTSDLSGLEKMKQMNEFGVLKRMAKEVAMGGVSESSTKGASWSRSDSIDTQAVSLMHPREILETFSRQSGLQMVFAAGHPAIALRRTPYYSDDHFKGKWT